LKRTLYFMDSSVEIDDILEDVGDLPKIRLKPITFEEQSDLDRCIICYENFEEGHRITICQKCNIHFHFNCQIEWLYYYNSRWNRNCCHCNQKWEDNSDSIKILRKPESLPTSPKEFFLLGKKYTFLPKKCNQKTPGTTSPQSL